jgi:IS5 family transposase
MFEIIILQHYYGLGDKQVEYQILEKISFENFWGLKTDLTVLKDNYKRIYP